MQINGSKIYIGTKCFQNTRNKTKVIQDNQNMNKLFDVLIELTFKVLISKMSTQLCRKSATSGLRMWQLRNTYQLGGPSASIWEIGSGSIPSEQLTNREGWLTEPRPFA